MSATAKLLVRPAVAEDEELLFSWRNEPWIVRGGSSQRQVERGEHHAWFQTTLLGQKRELWFVEIEGAAAGMVRYDFMTAEAAEISIYLLPPFWGKGHGKKVFLATAPALAVRRGVRRITAKVLPENAQSQEFFQRLGFLPAEPASASGLLIFHMDLATVPHSRPWLTGTETDRVAAVLKSAQIAKGPKVRELEQQWSQRTGTADSAAVGSGVGALRLALCALGVSSGDEVIMPAYSCVALMNAALAVGATPVLADVIPDAWTLSVTDVRQRLTSRTKAIIAVHLFGAPADMEALQATGIPVIEDCAHGIGGVTGGKLFGGAGALSITSFYATKMLAAGEGGMVASGQAQLIDKVRQARDYGDQPPDGRHLNDKMTDIEAVLALTQLERLPEILERRAQRARAYDELLRGFQAQGLLALPLPVPGRIWYRYAVRLIRHKAPAITERMAAAGVKAEQPVWDLRHTRFWNDTLSGSSLAFDRVVSLPLYPDLTEFEQRRVCAALEQSFQNE